MVLSNSNSFLNWLKAQVSSLYCWDLIDWQVRLTCFWAEPQQFELSNSNVMLVCWIAETFLFKDIWNMNQSNMKLCDVTFQRKFNLLDASEFSKQEGMLQVAQKTFGMAAGKMLTNISAILVERFKNNQEASEFTFTWWRSCYRWWCSCNLREKGNLRFERLEVSSIWKFATLQISQVWNFATLQITPK